MSDTQIKLISRQISAETNELGEAIEPETVCVIFAELKGVKRSEFYQAQAIGLKPEKTFEVFDFEYNGENIVEHEGKRYDVIRSYPVKGEKLELICKSLAEVN
jgi:SPP1 family predicted phage head-tail adaptor